MQQKNYRLLMAGVCICSIFLDFWAVQVRAQDLPAAEKALQAKNYDKVIELLGSQAEKLDSGGLNTLAEAYSAKDNHATAIKLYSTELGLHPKDASAQRKIGLEYLKMKKEKEAMVAFRQAIEINPDYEPAYMDLSAMLEKRGNPTGASKTKQNHYDQILLFDDLVKQKSVGRKPEYIAKLCELNTLDGQYEASPALCEEAITLNPRSPDSYVYMAMTLKAKDKGDEAKRYFIRAADSFSKSSFAQLALADQYTEEKNTLKAYPYYKRASEADPKSLKALTGWAQTALELQKYSEAYDALAKACKINRSATADVRKALRSATQQKNQIWTDKFDQLLETCGISDAE